MVILISTSRNLHLNNQSVGKREDFGIGDFLFFSHPSCTDQSRLSWLYLCSGYKSMWRAKEVKCNLGI